LVLGRILREVDDVKVFALPSRTQYTTALPSVAIAPAHA